MKSSSPRTLHRGEPLVSTPPAPAPRTSQPGTPPRAPSKPTSPAVPLKRLKAPTLLRHLLWAVRRYAFLIIVDLASFGSLRAAYRQLVSEMPVGRVSAWFEGFAGNIDGWQYATALFLGLLVTGNYGAGDRRRDAMRLLAGCALGTALTLWTQIWNHPLALVLVQFAAFVSVVGLTLIAERTLLDWLYQRLQLQKRPEKLLLVGAPVDCELARQSAAFGRRGEFEEVRSVEPAAAGSNLRSAHTELVQAIAESRPDTVVVCGSISERSLQAVIDAARMCGCRVLASSHIWDAAGVDPHVMWQHGEPIFELSAPAVRAPQLAFKRAMDTVGALAGLLALSPLFAAVALLVRFDTPGPVFFPSERWGQGGRRIRIWKFRTMVQDASALLDGDPVLRRQYDENVKLAGDPRVTRVGQWLRRLSIDELPQLYNVLTGDMSLVGPRPKLLGEEHRYEALFDVVLSVPPGMTGLWQVSGRNKLTYAERVALDVDYVRRCSLWLDITILLKTVPVVLRGSGAH